MNMIQIFTASGHDQVQLVVGGQVPGMLSTAHTFNISTVRVVEPIQAHRPRAASEPRPLVGEGELKQNRLEREIAELEAEQDYLEDRLLRARRSKSVHGVIPVRKQLAVSKDSLESKRRELGALSMGGATDRDASPTNGAGSADRPPRMIGEP